MGKDKALIALGTALNALEVRWALAGGLAANRYRPMPRTTEDIDLVVAWDQGSRERITAALQEGGWSVRFMDSDGELLRLGHDEYGLADLIVAGTEYQLQALSRARREPLAGTFAASVLQAEDVIVHKLIANRYQDLADIEAILAAGTALDEPYIERWATFWEVSEAWRKLRQEAGP